jgi:hypothetical protein
LKDVFCREQGRTLGNQRHRIEPLAETEAEHGADAFPQERRDRRPADQHHPFERILAEAVRGQQARADVERTVDDRSDQRLVFRSRDDHVDVDALAEQIEPGQENGRLGGARQLDLGLLGGQA